MFTKKEYDFTVKGPWTEACVKTTTEWKWKLEGSILHIAFRGSTAEKGSKDWLQNFTVPLWPARAFKNMKVVWFSHLGFHKKWQSVQHDVFDLIRRLNPKNICVYGFSQVGPSRPALLKISAKASRK